MKLIQNPQKSVTNFKHYSFIYLWGQLDATVKVVVFNFFPHTLIFPTVLNASAEIARRGYSVRSASHAWKIRKGQLNPCFLSVSVWQVIQGVLLGLYLFCFYFSSFTKLIKMGFLLTKMMAVFGDRGKYIPAIPLSFFNVLIKLLLPGFASKQQMMCFIL